MTIDNEMNNKGSGKMESRSEISSSVTSLISTEFGVRRDVILPEAKLIDDLGLDSIDLCDALVRLEGMTGKPFPLERFRGVVTVDDFVEQASKIVLDPSNPTESHR